MRVVFVINASVTSVTNVTRGVTNKSAREWYTVGAPVHTQSWASDNKSEGKEEHE